MNLVPEVIVIIMSVVVVLSLVHLSVLSFLSWGGTQIVCTENEKERRRVISLSLSLSLSVSSWGSKKKLEEREEEGS